MLVGLGFLVFLTIVVLGLVTTALYNSLVQLRTTCLQTSSDLCAIWVKKAGHITDGSIVHLVSVCHKATTIDSQVHALNAIAIHLASLQKPSVEQQNLLDLEEEMQPEKRFFNSAAKDMQRRLVVFPTKFIGSLFTINPVHLLDVKEMSHDSEM